MSSTQTTPWPGLIHHYRRHLDISESTPVVTLHEGNTPLVRCERLARHIGIDAELHLKLEGMNPTASFKDRGMTMAITKAVERGAKAVICASTGNTSAAAAAYAARAGIKAFVVVPHGNIAKGKLSQAVVHGARILSIEGSFNQALKMVAGNITAYWRGYGEYKALGITRGRPKMMGFQASGAAPIVRGYAIERPETIATAIRIGNPASWQQAEQARDDSGGIIDEVSDEEILAAYQALGRLEGVFCEPASAASVAGVIKQARSTPFASGDVVVCTLTGHGLKDPDTALKQVGEPTLVPPSLDKLAGFLELA